jgi:uncharacterized membrane protein YdjX (TVP38/TMEM64 family)
MVTRLGALCLLAALLLIVWRYSPLREFGDPARLGVVFDNLRNSPWAGPLVVSGFLFGSFLVLPVTGMIAATGIALGPTDGLLWASVGSFVGATVNYGIARMLPDSTIESWVGPWVGRMGRRLQRGGILPVMVARNVPFAPFTLINIVAGGARIPYHEFLIGTALGMAPVIAALTILGDRLRGAWEAPTIMNISLLVLVVVCWFLLAYALQALSNRWLSHARRMERRR